MSEVDPVALPSAAVVSEWRTTLGASTALWADGGRLEIEHDWWLAFSGAKSVDYNVILCHGANGARDLARSLEAVKAAKVPAVIMVAGPALSLTNLLSTEGWVCVGAKPFMVLTDLPTELDPAARRLLPGELAEAQAIIGEAFDVAPTFAERALPSVAATDPTREAWGLFDDDELVSCVGVVIIDRAVVIWSMATPPRFQKRGYGRRLLQTVLATHRELGATTAMLYSSAPGESMYRSLGYRTVEYWPVWSRSRWVFPPV